MSSGTPMKRAVNSSESSTRRSMAKSQQLTSCSGGAGKRGSGVIGSVSAALANHGGVEEPNRLAVSLPAARVSEVN